MQGGSGKLKHSIFALIAALVCAAVPVAAEPRLQVSSILPWERAEPWFGGFSGMEVSDDGTLLTLISDRGSLVRARLVREEGRLSAIEMMSRQTLKDADGSDLRAKYRDAEGLAIGRDGQAFGSFESKDGVARINLNTGRITGITGHPEFARMNINSGLEALAIHPDGRLFTLSEVPANPSDTTPLYEYANGTWRIPYRIPVSGPFRPVGADFDDAGRLYLLERTVTPLGFRSQIRRFDLNADPVVAETLLSTFPASYDNLEAISLWTDPSGITRVLTISDDNFFALQTTQIVEFTLIE